MMGGMIFGNKAPLCHPDRIEDVAEGSCRLEAPCDPLPVWAMMWLLIGNCVGQARVVSRTCSYTVDPSALRRGGSVGMTWMDTFEPEASRRWATDHLPLASKTFMFLPEANGLSSLGQRPRTLQVFGITWMDHRTSASGKQNSYALAGGKWSTVLRPEASDSWNCKHFPHA